MGEVDDTAFDKRAAVVDADDNGTASLLIDDTHSGAKGKRAVSGRQRMGVETLTVRRKPAVETRAIPRRMAALNRSLCRLRSQANSSDNRSAGGRLFEINEQNATPSCR